MNTYDIILTIIIILCLLLHLVTVTFLKHNKNIRIPVFAYCILLLLCAIHYLIRGLNYIALPLYAAAFLMQLSVLIKRFRPFSLVLLSLTLLLTLAPSALFLILKGLDTSVIDLSSASYEKSFTALHNEIKESYPLAKHKNINFDGKYADYIEYFKKADHDNSKKEYYTALMKYLKSYQDGHFYIRSIPQMLGYSDNFPKELLTEAIGGSYGFTIIELDDKRVIVTNVIPDSPAEQSGIKQGTQITKWNGIDIKEAVKDVSILWNYKYISCASEEQIRHNQLSLLTRAPQGEQASVSFIDLNQDENTILLTAKSDNLDLLRKDLGTFYQSFSDTVNLTYRVIDETHGYILLKEMPEDVNETYYNKFHHILEEMKSKAVKDIIIDMRSNSGGSDEFGAHILGLLTDTPIYYLQELTYQRTDNEFTSYRDAILTEPSSIGLSIPVVILVNNQTISAGEGFVYHAGKLSNVRIAGMSGTNGSFGTILNTFLMPDNLLIFFPQVVCVDENGNVLIDTDSSGDGGIQPDIRIPIDEYAVKRLYEDDADYELEYLFDYLNE